MGRRRHLPLAFVVACVATLALAAGASAAGSHVSLAVRVKPAGSDRIVASGRVTPAPRVARVEVQARRRQGWRRFSGGRLNHGAFKISTHATGTLILRARAFQGKRLLGVSAVRKLQIAATKPSGQAVARRAAPRGVHHPGAQAAPGRRLQPPPKTPCRPRP